MGRNATAAAPAAAKLVIGRRVDDEASALQFANEFFATCITYFPDVIITKEQRDENPIEWTLVNTTKNGIRIESANVTGDAAPFATSGNKNNNNKVKLFRSSFPIGGNMSVEEFYTYITSKEGYQLIDPMSDPANFDKPLLGPFSWEGRGKVQVEKSSMKVPLLSKRECLVLNASDSQQTQGFLCVSCVNPELLPGKAPYDDSSTKCEGTAAAVQPGRNGEVRMSFASCYFVSSSANNNQIYLHIAQFMDLNGWMHCNNLNNMANQQWFEGFADRIEKKFPPLRK